MFCNILSQMDLLDANKPITLSIEFDESDEDDNLHIKPKSLPLIETNISEETITIPNFSSEGLQDTFSDDLNKNRKRPLILKKEANISNDEKFYNNNESKRKYPRTQKLDNSVFKNLINRYYNGNIDSVNNRITDNQMSTITNISERTNSAHTNVGFQFYNLNNENGSITKEVNINNYDLLKSLLRVSKILITIIKMHNRVSVKSDKINEKDIQKLRRNFISMKYHLFSLSYNTVVSLFLSREKNKTFVNSFLSDTMTFFKEYNKEVNCSHETLKLVFYEMIKWSKEKKKQIEFLNHITKMEQESKHLPPSSVCDKNDYHNNMNSNQVTTASVAQINNNNTTYLKEYRNNTLPLSMDNANSGHNVMHQVANITMAQGFYPTVTREHPNQSSMNKTNTNQNVTHYESPYNNGQSNNANTRTLREYLNRPILSNLNNRNAYRGNMSITHPLTITNMIQSNNNSNPTNVTNHFYLPYSNVNNRNVNNNNMIHNAATTNITESNDSNNTTVLTKRLNYPTNSNLNNRTVYHNSIVQRMATANTISGNIINKPTITSDNDLIYPLHSTVIDRNTCQNDLDHVTAADNVLTAPTTCIFSSSPSEAAITINVDSSLLNKSQNTYVNRPCTASTNQCPYPRNSNDLQGSTYSNESQIGARLQYNKSQSSQIEHSSHTPPPTYYEWCSRNQAQSMTAQNGESIQMQQENHTTHKPILNYVETTPPSLSSTDSGFMSPFNFNAAADQMNDVFPEDQTEEFNPLITHVTSLNPKASFSWCGSCYVCGRSTKQRCGGCLKYYYCSYKCQTSDWSCHELLCDLIANNRFEWVK